MAVTVKWYSSGFLAVFNKTLDIDTDVLKALLIKPAYTPNQATHDFLNDVTANECSTVGTGYARQTLGAPVQSQAANVWQTDFNDIAFGTLTLTGAGLGPRYAAIYDETSGATDATRPLLFYCDFGAEQNPNGQTFTIQWPTGGPLKITVSTV